MTAQQFRPLTDEALRAHLSRRAEAPPPPSLAGDVFEALDRVPVRVRASGLPSFRLGWGGLGLRVPRLAAAALSIALVMAVGLGTLAILPALRSPAANVAGAQPLTTAQLAAVAGDATTPVNATLVASTTIESKPDACPMDRYPTVGILVGTVKQVCVMGSGVNAYLRAESVTGVFAFRVIAPGVLGLLGQLTPKADGSLTYKVVDDWPLQGKAFLVDGWLGSTELLASCVTDITTAADPLNPTGSDCPFQDWLSDESTAPEISSYHVGDPTPPPGYENLALRGKARPVEAAGMRAIDGPRVGSTVETPAIRAIYVVSTVNGPCPGASPADSTGCSAWRVLARVSDIGLGKSSPSPAPSSSVPSDGSAVWDPVTRPLTASELGRVLAGGTAKTGQTLVANVAITASAACSASPSAYASWGQVQGVSPPVCVVASPTISVGPPAGQATLAFRVVGPSTIGYLGFVTSASGRLAFSADGFWPAGSIFLVDGILGSYGLYCPSGDRPADASPDDLMACRSMWLVNKVPVQYGGAPSGANRVYRTAGDGLGTSPDGRGVYLVQTAAATCSADATPSTPTCSIGNLLARVDPVSVPAAMFTPPVTQPPAPTGSAAPTSAEPPALIGPGNRALTVDEARAAVKALPGSFVPRLAVVAGPLPIQECSAHSGNAAAVSCTISPTADGTWLTKVTREGDFSPVGRIATPAGGLVSAVADAYGAKPSDGQKIVVIDAWLAGAAMDACDIKASPMPTCDEVSWLSADATAQAAATDGPSHIAVWPGDYHRYSGGAAGGGPAVRALYAVELRPDGARVLARLEVAASASPTPVATETPGASDSPGILMSPHTSVLVGKGNVPLTLDQLQAAFLQDPKDLVWQLAIVSGALPQSIGCLPLDGPAGAAASASPACGDTHSGSGPWLIRLNDFGQPQYAGRVDPGPAGLAWDVAALSKAEPKHVDSTFLVTGWLLGSAGVKCDQAYQGSPPPPCDEYAWLSQRQETGMILYPAPSPDDVPVWDGDAHRFGATSDGSGILARYGTFLVSRQWNGYSGAYVLSVAEPVGP